MFLLLLDRFVWKRGQRLILFQHPSNEENLYTRQTKNSNATLAFFFRILLHCEHVLCWLLWTKQIGQIFKLELSASAKGIFLSTITFKNSAVGSVYTECMFFSYKNLLLKKCNSVIRINQLLTTETRESYEKDPLSNFLLSPGLQTRLCAHFNLKTVKETVSCPLGRISPSWDLNITQPCQKPLPPQFYG